MSDLVGNPEDRFSQNEAQIIFVAMKSQQLSKTDPIPSAYLYQTSFDSHPLVDRQISLMTFQTTWMDPHSQVTFRTPLPAQRGRTPEIHVMSECLGEWDSVVKMRLQTMKTIIESGDNQMRYSRQYLLYPMPMKLLRQWESTRLG